MGQHDHPVRQGNARENLPWHTAHILTREGRELSWVNNIRYLGIYVESALSFKCSLDAAKRSFCRSFNAIFGKVGRIALNEVIIQLIKTKCFNVKYYGLEAYPLRKLEYNSINSSFRKVFDTKSQEVIIIVYYAEAAVQYTQ